MSFSHFLSVKYNINIVDEIENNPHPLFQHATTHILTYLRL